MKIGCHLALSSYQSSNNSKGQQIIQCILALPEIGANALQIFMSPRNGVSNGKPLDQNEADEIAELLVGSRSFLVVHGKYDLNFCDLKVKWYQDGLIADLRRVAQINDQIGVVIHQGKNVARMGIPHEEAVSNYVNQIKSVIDKTKNLKNRILLENSCQQGTELGYTLEGLAEIWDQFEPKYRKRLGFCLDTCHIFVAGTLQMKSSQDVDDFFRRFDQLLGLDYLKVIHFNDSKTPFDGHNDYHHDLTAGFITNPDYQSTVKKYQNVGSDRRGHISGLQQVLAWAKLLEVPLILETPRNEISCEDQLRLAQKWSKEVELPSRLISKKKRLNFKKK